MTNPKELFPGQGATGAAAVPEWQDPEILVFWQRAGGTVYSSAREMGAMPTHKLKPLLRELLRGQTPAALRPPEPVDLALLVREDPPQTLRAASESELEDVLRALIDAVVPGLSTGDVLRDAQTAAAAMEVTGPAGYFRLEVVPGDADAERPRQRFVAVEAIEQHADDVFPLFHRARQVDERSHAAENEDTEGAARAPAAAARKTRKDRS